MGFGLGGVPSPPTVERSWMTMPEISVKADVISSLVTLLERQLEVVGHGTINVIRVLESTQTHRAGQLFPKLAEWVNGHSYSLKRRDNEMATDVSWFELTAAIERHSERNGIGLQRYKGLGEMNPEQLWETTMDPTKRTLLQVNADQAAEADDVFTTLMGDLVQPRKEFIQAHARQVKNLDI